MTGFTNANAGVGVGDPGWLDPITLKAPNPVSEMWYDRLPALYRDADAADVSTSLGYPLWGFIDAMASVLAEPLKVAGRVVDGGLTNPSLAADEWIPWMAQAAGVSGQGVADMRMRLATLVTAPPLGSRNYLEALTQTFLTGTRSVEVTGVPPWGIRIRVRSAEAVAAGGEAGLAAKLYASGLIPAGFAIQVTVDQETWSQIEAVLPTWAPGQGATWARILSMGLTGSGLVSGAVRWVGTAAGVRP